MEINAIGSIINGTAFTGTKRNESSSADIQAKAHNANADSVVKLQQVKDVQASEKDRLDTVIQASKAIQNTFVVSDSKFTIFKDSNGQFVTRFTNLADGSVTYLPEPDIVRFMESQSAQRASLIEVEA